RGGVVAGIEDGSLEQAIAESAYEQQRKIEDGERVIVGVNAFAEEGEAAPVDTFQVGADVLERQLARLARSREERDELAVSAALAGVEAAAEGTENMMPAIVTAVRAYATTAEISDALVRVFGRHVGSQVV
ncbi:MAG: methylmalonyl-CoA mutase, partial [Actinobacteria bacterium]|nr:methylmalonyl-CoA mutase [Actinomycetota bacterium]